ncbi:MAG: hypothetical protein O2794_01250 [bacterium]|nr:hypothetical protein [bacterium]
MSYVNYQKGGVIQAFIIIALVVIILSLLGVSLGALFSDKTIRDNFVFIWNGIGYLWENYAEGLWNFLRDNLFDPIKDKVSGGDSQSELETATSTQE